MRRVKAMQNNMIARFTDLGAIWLYTNVRDNSGWVRSLMSISNGRNYVPRTGCTLEALVNLGEVTAAASREHDVAGCDWTRTIVHWRGHYFVVFDRMEATGDDEFAFVCRWRCPQLAGLQNGVWTATAPTAAGSASRTRSPWPRQPSTGKATARATYVLQQYKQARLSKGQAETCQNLLFVAGGQRPDEFEARRLNADAILVKGKTKDGEHLALHRRRGPDSADGFRDRCRALRRDGKSAASRGRDDAQSDRQGVHGRDILVREAGKP